MDRTSTLSFGHGRPPTGLSWRSLDFHYTPLGSIDSTFVAPGSESLLMNLETSATYSWRTPLSETECPPSAFKKCQSEVLSEGLSADACLDSVSSRQAEGSNATAPLPMYSMVITTPWDPELRYRFGTKDHKLSNNDDFVKKLVSVSAYCLRLWYDNQQYSNQRAWKVSRRIGDVPSPSYSNLKLTDYVM